MAESVEERIAEWLESQGYPLEMAVARAFRARRFRVRQSEYYVDTATQQSREIDVLATLQSDFDGRALRVGFPVECKLASKKPWLVFADSSIRLASPASIVQRAASTPGRAFLQALAERDRKISQFGFFSLPSAPGYAVTEAFSSRRDTAYEALMSVTSAARGLAASLDGSRVAAIFFPIVVIDGQLFQCHLSDTDEVVVRGIHSTALVWRNPIVRAPHTIVHISTQEGLSDLLTEAERTVEELMAREQILKSAVGRPTEGRRIRSRGVEL